MSLNHDTCYRALKTRDPRFDGRFFTGVTSTGVYCRPVCPALTPKVAHCVFFACAAAAEGAGFRPCRRCRPETAPGTPAWRGTSATVSRGLQLIEAGALDSASVGELAQRLGVGSRHLRRLFVEHLGASPAAIGQTRRAHFANRLIQETDLPMTRIALASGYRNVRRFNAEVRRIFGRSPREIRQSKRKEGRTAEQGHIVLRQAYRAPFDWQAMLAFLAPRAIPGVESISGGVYRRTVDDPVFTGVIEVTAAPTGAGDELLLRVPASATLCLGRLSARVRELFDLAADPLAIADQLGTDARLKPIIRAHPGLRMPGAWNRFEMAVRAILGQQITVAGASRLAGKLVQAVGRPIDAQGSTATPHLLFPRPEDLADADIAAIGMPRTRADSIRSLARAICDGGTALETAPSLEVALERLTALPGIGDWTAQYIAMRALREPDAFPAGDLGLRKAWAQSESLPTASALKQQADAWRPWRAYAAMWLWASLSS